MQKREKEDPEEALMQKAVAAGIHSLISQPGLRNYGIPLRKNLDWKKVHEVADAIKYEITKQKIPEKEQGNFFYKNLASYIASGNALKTDWKKTALEKSYGGKLDQNALEKIVSFFKPHKFDGEKYFEKAQNAYGDMYDILSQDKVAQQEIPELVEAAKSLKMYGFLDAALATFKTHEMMDDKTYKKLSQELYKTTAIKSQSGMSGIEKYILSQREREAEKESAKEKYQKAAAFIIGIFGVIHILFNAKITGAIIGATENNISGLIGSFMVLISMLLFFGISKKKNRATASKKK